MALAYLDTSALLKLVLQEDGEERVLKVINQAGRVCCSVITYAEGRATLSRHYAEQAQLMTGKGKAAALAKLAAEHQGVIQDFNALWDDINEVDVTPAIYRVAGDLTVAHPGLRGMDALHLASALEVQKVEAVWFLTFDDRLALAAEARLGKKALR
ncbi:hypothetical protein Dxin01_03493 [Deinococcus xinjiangensis]|uniref:Ribonuclease VapC n=1 Tax=Deinococcus xinjiangensis TaxID=457454 RepID=A0ABP9VET8_9DEIO